MLPIRNIPRFAANSGLLKSPLKLGVVSYRASSYRGYASKSNKESEVPDIRQIPINMIAVLGDFYVPPKMFKASMKIWHKLILRRIGNFFINTYGIIKYKRETDLNLKFNDWKEIGMEKFVQTNKVFSAACNKPVNQRSSFIKSQLDNIAGDLVIQNLIKRAASFPSNTKIDWELLSVETNPKIVTFICLPDANDLATYVQFTMNVTTKQKVTLTDANKKVTTKETTASENLVYTMDPFADELVFVGTVFESSFEKGIQPELNRNNPKIMSQFQRACADIYRSAPAIEGK